LNKEKSFGLISRTAKILINLWSNIPKILNSCFQKKAFLFVQAIIALAEFATLDPTFIAGAVVFFAF
jgi:hypothetical protein